MLTRCSRRCAKGRLIEKTRYIVPHGGLDWEVDVFEGSLTGLVIAEVELARPDQAIAFPDWVGQELTGDKRFGSAALATAIASGQGVELP